MFCECSIFTLLLQEGLPLDQVLDELMSAIQVTKRVCPDPSDGITLIAGLVQ